MRNALNFRVCGLTEIQTGKFMRESRKAYDNYRDLQRKFTAKEFR